MQHLKKIMTLSFLVHANFVWSQNINLNDLVKEAFYPNRMDSLPISKKDELYFIKGPGLSFVSTEDTTGIFPFKIVPIFERDIPKHLKGKKSIYILRLDIISVEPNEMLVEVKLSKVTLKGYKKNTYVHLDAIKKKLHFNNSTKLWGF